MAFNNLYFLFIFLPISLLIYYICPKKFRTVPMVAFSLLFYAWGSVQYLFILAFSVLFNYIVGLQLSAYQASEREKAAKICITIAVLVNLLLLGFFKYYGFLINNINAVTGLKLRYTQLSLPLGISFFTFTVLSYDFDVYRKKVAAQKNILKFATYVTFFPKLTSGPIVQYHDMEQQLDERKMAPAKFGAGINMMIIGLAKKVIIADNLSTTFNTIYALTNMSIGTAWIGIFAYFLQLYFDFSGYSDMAIGMAKLFGFNFDKNFNYPYSANSLGDFWNRWHISLAAWFKEYLYFPLGGSRCSKAKAIRNVMLVWLATGIWHGASWTYVLWGLYQGCFILLEKYVIKDQLAALPHVAQHVLGITAVLFSWPLFFSTSFSGLVHYYGQMIGLGHLGIFDSAFFYYFRTNIILLLIAVLGTGPLMQKLHSRLAYWKGGKFTYVSVGFYVVLLFLSVAFVVSSTYSTFLYFQF